LRIGETDDGSAVGRTVLQVYGLLLFFARPIGYGLTFDSTEHWVGFWKYLKDFDNAHAITAYALHNYFLMMINKYGFPILFLAAAVSWRLARYKWSLLGFIPYLVQIFFHNDGPLMADFLIWYIIPMYAGLSRDLPRRSEVLRSDTVATLAVASTARIGSVSTAFPRARRGMQSFGAGDMA
jgi:hypothetical protein